MPDSEHSFANPFLAPEADPSRACLAWTLRLVIEDPKDPEGIRSPKRAWIDCALSGRAAHALALALPDWHARARQARNPSLAHKSLREIKIGALSSSLIELGHDLLGGQSAVHHSAGRICAIERPEHILPEHFVGRLVVCSDHMPEKPAAARLALAAEGFAQWSRDFVEPGHWAALAADASQLAWDPRFDAQRNENKQLRFWKPSGREQQFAAFFQAGFERALLLEQTRSVAPAAEAEARPGLRAARL